MMAFGNYLFTLGLKHPQLLDRHRLDTGHRNDDGDKRAENRPEHHVRRLLWVRLVHNVK